MLYKFKSKNSGDVIMLQPNGQQVLEIIGKCTSDEPSVQGILLPEQMPQALTALESAIDRDHAARKEAVAKAEAENLPLPQFDAVTLHQRAQPFMEMVRRCLATQTSITWGV